MTESMRAYCGLDCTECPAHLAWKTDDDELRKKQAAEWGSPDYPITAEEINCVGCASERGVETCAHCDDYGCDTLEGWLSQAGDELRQKLERLRAAL